MPRKARTGPRRGGPRKASPASDGLATPQYPTLEAVLIAFQKSLSRSVDDAHNALRSNPELLIGRRPLYVAEGLEVSLKAGVFAPEGTQAVMLDLAAPASERSEIRFKIATRPVDAVSGVRLELSLLEPGPAERSTVRVRAMVVGPDGLGLRGQPITLILVGNGDVTARVNATTDALGRADVSLQVGKDRVQATSATGTRTRLTLASDRELFAWATWTPPEANLPAATSVPDVTSNVMRIRAT
jgi:hypothetical protein